MQSNSLRDQNKNTFSVRYWMESCMKREIENLPLLDGERLYSQFYFLSNTCDDTGMDFWKFVEEVGGFHAIRILIHAILVAKGINREPERVGETTDQRKDQLCDKEPRLL